MKIYKNAMRYCLISIKVQIQDAINMTDEQFIKIINPNDKIEEYEDEDNQIIENN